MKIIIIVGHIVVRQSEHRPSLSGSVSFLGNIRETHLRDVLSNVQEYYRNRLDFTFSTRTDL